MEPPIDYIGTGAGEGGEAGGEVGGEAGGEAGGEVGGVTGTGTGTDTGAVAWSPWDISGSGVFDPSFKNIDEYYDGSKNHYTLRVAIYDNVVLPGGNYTTYRFYINMKYKNDTLEQISEDILLADIPLTETVDGLYHHPEMATIGKRADLVDASRFADKPGLEFTSWVTIGGEPVVSGADHTAREHMPSSDPDLGRATANHQWGTSETADPEQP